MHINEFERGLIEGYLDEKSKTESKNKSLLIPAILRKDEIINEFRKLQYTDDLMYEVGSCDNYMPQILEEPPKEVYQYAIVGPSGKLLGYISYKIDWYSSQAHNFGLMSFDRGNPLVGKALHDAMVNILEVMKIHRIEWNVVSGNPVEDAYDRFCLKYKGNKLRLRDAFKDRLGKYHNVFIYEIINKKER